MTTVVTNKKESILKVIIFWVSFYALFIAVTSQSGAIFPSQVHRFVSVIAGAAIALIITWLFIKSEKKTLADSFNCFCLTPYTTWMESPGSFYWTRSMGINFWYSSSTI
jgi:hypothetical protein